MRWRIEPSTAGAVFTLEAFIAEARIAERMCAVAWAWALQPRTYTTGPHAGIIPTRPVIDLSGGASERSPALPLAPGWADLK